MSSPSPIVKTRLKGPLHARFLAERAARGISESELLRLALLQLFENKHTTFAPAETVIDVLETGEDVSPEHFRLERKTVWMPPFLMQEASARASAKGMSFSRWVRAMIQFHVMRRPVFTDAELLALEASIRELAAIGRHLNQIARAVDAAYFQTERIRLDKLAELSTKIMQTRRAIGRLVRASRRSWRT